MYVIEARNVNYALYYMLKHLSDYGVRRETRAGGVVVAPTPVTTIYQRPVERVLFGANRDANPFFHLFESLWMLAGRRDIHWISYYNKRMLDFSDDGMTQHGAYGYRWRNWFHSDQLISTIDLLRNKPASRRAVIQMYDFDVDFDETEGLRDVPCNLVATPWLSEDGVGGRPSLNLAVFCRSNDAVWGAAGANAVHFSVLQEFLAAMLNAEVGVFYQISRDFHAYTNIFDPLVEALVVEGLGPLLDPYIEGSRVHTSPVFLSHVKNDSPRWWLAEIEAFVDDPSQNAAKDPFNLPFLNEVASPMARAFKVFRDGQEVMDLERYPLIQSILSEGPHSSDWLVAARTWMTRRQAKEAARKAAGLKGEKGND